MTQAARPARVVLERASASSDLWVAKRITTTGTELERSPEGTFEEAEQYRLNYHRYGAWQTS